MFFSIQDLILKNPIRCLLAAKVEIYLRLLLSTVKDPHRFLGPGFELLLKTRCALHYAPLNPPKTRMNWLCVAFQATTGTTSTNRGQGRCHMSAQLAKILTAAKLPWSTINSPIKGGQTVSTVATHFPAFPTWTSMWRSITPTHYKQTFDSCWENIYASLRLFVFPLWNVTDIDFFIGFIVNITLAQAIGTRIQSKVETRHFNVRSALSGSRPRMPLQNTSRFTRARPNVNTARPLSRQFPTLTSMLESTTVTKLIWMSRAQDLYCRG